MKHILLTPALGAVILFGGCCSPRPTTPTALEYRVYKYGRLPTLDHSDELQKTMNDLASEGWTITQVITNPEDDNRCTPVMSRPKK